MKHDALGSDPFEMHVLHMFGAWEQPCSRVGVPAPGSIPSQSSSQLPLFFHLSVTLGIYIFTLY